MKVTSKTIAADLGLTAASVSVALNHSTTGTTKVSAATAAKVQAYAKKLNYRPSLAGRAMLSRKLRQIGILIDSDFGALRRIPIVEVPAIFGLNEFLSAEGWHLNIIKDDGKRGGELRLPRYLREKGLDGVVVCSRTEQQDDVIDRDLKRFSIPAVFLNTERKFNCVKLDDRWGGMLATRHLIELGHRRIVFVGGNISHSSHAERLGGYQQTMDEHGLPAAAYFSARMSSEENEGYQRRLAAKYEDGRWFAQEVYLKERPSAVFCYDDILALTLLKGLYEIGVDVPGDVSIVGFNDMPFMDILPSPLTTVRSDFYAMGRLAGELLLKLIENPSTRLASSMIRPELVVRETTRPLAGAGTLAKTR